MTRIALCAGWALGCGCFAFSGLAFSPGGKDTIDASAGAEMSAAVAHHCAVDLQPVFSCMIDKSGDAEIVSVCLGPDHMDLITGPLDNPSWDARTNANWSNIRLGEVFGGGGGSQKHIRFSTEDGEEMIVFSGYHGSLHDGADGPYAGIYTEAPDGTYHRYECKGEFHSEIGSSAFYSGLRSAAPEGAVEEEALLEEPGGSYDAWF